MSGVFGVLDSQRRLPVNRLLSRMGNQMSHRDWYVVETYCDEQAGVGLGRIGIGIFNPERQPVFSEDGNLVVFLRGELFEMADHRHELQARGVMFRDDSDLELILRLYQDRGERFIHALEGAFVLAIWDRRRQHLIVANDRAGLYPTYYAHYDGRLIFAPEMKGVLSDPDYHAEIDLTALAEYVRFQHLLGDKTFFVDLRLLPSASLLEYDLRADRLAVQSYWDFSEIPQLPLSITFEEAVDEAGRLLKAAIHRLTQGKHRLGVYLSGGLDSRVILGMVGHERFPMTTITYGLRGCRDMAYARRIATLMGTRHRYFEFRNGEWVKEYADFHLELAEGFHSWIHAHGISILEQVRPLIDVNLTGLHGAELNWEDLGLYQAQDDDAFTCKLFYSLSQETTWPSLNDVEERLLYSPSIASQMVGLAFDSFRAELARWDHLPYERRAMQFSCATDRRLYQYYTVFHRSHFEQRFPFYDYRYFEFVHALPPQMLFKRRLRKAVILKRMPSLARIPYDKDNLPIKSGALAVLAAKAIQKSESYMNRHVAHLFPEYTPLYADYENWLRAELREWGENILLGERTLQRDFFSPEFLQSLWLRHQSGLEVNIIGKLAPLMTYEMMLRRFYD